MSGTEWTAAQEAFLRANPTLPYSALAPELKKRGPARSRHSVRSKRSRLNVSSSKTRAENMRAVALERARLAAEADAARLYGFCPKKDAAFVRMVVRGWAELQGLRVAA